MPKSSSPYDQRTLNRFWSKVDKSGECWEWTGALNPGGYGKFSLKGRALAAHRVAWLASNGTIPQAAGYHGVCVLHRCDNRACVNPDHLFLGTQADNLRDRDEKGRTQRGKAHYKAKLREESVLDIRKMLDAGIPHSEIARQFGVVRTAITAISTGRSWKHVR